MLGNEKPKQIFDIEAKLLMNSSDSITFRKAHGDWCSNVKHRRNVFTKVQTTNRHLTKHEIVDQPNPKTVTQSNPNSHKTQTDPSENRIVHQQNPWKPQPDHNHKPQPEKKTHILEMLVTKTPIVSKDYLLHMGEVLLHMEISWLNDNQVTCLVFIMKIRSLLGHLKHAIYSSKHIHQIKSS